MAVVDIHVAARDEVKSYEGRRETSYLRLRETEASTIRYVLCGWDSEVGLGSNFGAMIAAIASQDDPGNYCELHRQSPEMLTETPEKVTLDEMRDFRRERKACFDCKEQRRRRQAMKISGRCDDHEMQATLLTAPKDRAVLNRAVKACPDCAASVGGGPSASPAADPHTYDAKADHAIERWCGKSKVEREKILACWRALGALSQARSPSVVILRALYGDMPPGMPAPGVFGKVAVDLEYRRVVRYVDGSGGSTAALEAMLRVDEHRRKDEGDAEFNVRIIQAKAVRRARVLELAERCERVIERAAIDYRVALRGAQP